MIFRLLEPKKVEYLTTYRYIVLLGYKQEGTSGDTRT